MVGIRGPIHTNSILAKEWESEIDTGFLPGVQQRETLFHHEGKRKEGARIFAHALDSTALPAVLVVVGGEVQLHRILAIDRIIFRSINFELVNIFMTLGNVIHQVVQLPTVICIEGAEQMRLAPFGEEEKGVHASPVTLE